MDPRRRGDYQGVSELGGTLGRFWAPAVYGFLAMEWGAFGWLTIAAHRHRRRGGPPRRRARLARRFLEQHVPADVLADATRRRSRPSRARTRPRPDRPRCSARSAPLPESTGDLIR